MVREGYKQTEVGVIPEDWDCVLLDSIAKRGSGHTPDKKHPEYWNGSIKWISLKDSDRLDALYIDDTADKTTPLGIANSSAVVHSAGTVVLSRDAGIGKSAIMKDEMAVSQHFMAWQCSPRLDNHFLYYWLQIRKPEFERIAIGNTIKTIGLPYFRDLKIPFPTIEEQRSIAKALSDVDALTAALEKAIAKKRAIKTATMQQLLTGKKRLPGFGEGKSDRQTEVGLIPEDWQVSCLDSITKLSSGTTPSRAQEDRYYRNGKYYWVKTTDLNNSRITTTEEKVTKAALDETCLQIYPSGTVLVAMYGGFNQIGRTGLICIPAAVNQALVAIQAQPKRLNPEYLLETLNYRVEHWKSVASSSRKDPNITSQDVKNFVLPLPPVEEQQVIATVLSDMDAEIAALETRLAKTQSIKQGMMQELLTGRTRLI